MPISTFPPEILGYIFEYLAFKPHFLLLCAVVNHSWCSIAIPMLWRNPFYLGMEGEQYKVRYKLLIDTYFKCFNEEARRRILEKKEIHADTLLSIDTFFNAENQSTFRYASFLKTLNIADVSEAIESWIQWLTSEDTNDCLQELLTYEFFRLLWSELPAIQDFVYQCYPPPISHDVWMLPGAAWSLSKVSYCSLSLWASQPIFLPFWNPIVAI